MLVVTAMTLLTACGTESDNAFNSRQPTRQQLAAAWKEAELIIQQELAKAEARTASSQEIPHENE
ncbi:MAG: hypothetical protein R3F58_11865 [Steroidobacteraceae bacterium]